MDYVVLWNRTRHEFVKYGDALDLAFELTHSVSGENNVAYIMDCDLGILKLVTYSGVDNKPIWTVVEV